MNRIVVPRPLVLCVALVLLSLSLPTCGDDSELGETCRDDRDCDRDKVCAEGGDFPDGLCTYTCDNTRDCPGGWSCIDKKGGICLEECSSDRECRSVYGGRWECKDEKFKGGGGRDAVCIGD